MPEELWTEVHEIVQEAVIKTISKKKKCKKVKWLSEEALQIAEKGKDVKGKGEKERYTHLNADFQRIARGDKKAFLSDQCKEIEENNIMGKTISQTGFKITGRNINNLRYADDTTLMAESGEELKSLLMKVKEDSEKLA